MPVPALVIPVVPATTGAIEAVMAEPTVMVLAAALAPVSERVGLVLPTATL